MRRMTYLIVSALALGMIAPVAAQQDQNQTQQRNQSLNVTGDCMMSPNATEQQAFMTCRYYVEDVDGDTNFLDQMREWMERMFGSSDMNQSGQNAGGMQGQ